MEQAAVHTLNVRWNRAPDRRDLLGGAFSQFRHRCKKPSCVGVFGVVEDVVDGRRLHLLSEIHDQHLIRQLRNDRQVVRDDDERHLQFLLEILDQLQHLRLNRYVDGCRRLVGDQQPGATGEGHGNHGALAHTSTQIERIGVNELGRLRHTHPCQHRCGLLAGLTFGHPLVQHDCFHDLVADRVHRRERGHRFLKDHCDLCAANLTYGAPLGVERHQVDASLARRVQDDATVDDRAVLRNNAQNRLGRDALAAAALPCDAEGLAVIEGETEAVHRPDGSLPREEVGLEVLDAEQQIRGRSQVCLHQTVA